MQGRRVRSSAGRDRAAGAGPAARGRRRRLRVPLRVRSRRRGRERLWPLVDRVLPDRDMTAARDAAAYKLIHDTRAARLTRASTRAEKWIAGLTALVTVLTTAMVVKGPENFAQ